MQRKVGDVWRVGGEGGKAGRETGGTRVSMKAEEGRSNNGPSFWKQQQGFDCFFLKVPILVQRTGV